MIFSENSSMQFQNFPREYLLITISTHRVPYSTFVNIATLLLFSNTWWVTATGCKNIDIVIMKSRKLNCQSCIGKNKDFSVFVFKQIVKLLQLYFISKLEFFWLNEPVKFCKCHFFCAWTLGKSMRWADSSHLLVSLPIIFYEVSFITLFPFTTQSLNWKESMLNKSLSLKKIQFMSENITS